ncbi:MAG: hypothetical protein ABS68_12135 [Niastella sp. SCN 39-18]|nr:hypothetical protein [Sphingobacteriales bacterium]ODT51707.1 MAG: hypothetical protein ABS68_12135 [Niastella sp. SCN 39-18]OJW09734.1 MAG: hypothetical protein BGO53_07740 [Sphingobacteriales bacterium 39-19]
MCYELKTQYGGTEAVIDDNCGVNKFYAIAKTLADDLQVTFLNQVDESQDLDWDFMYKQQFLTLHFNTFNGVSIVPRPLKKKNKEIAVVRELAHFLEKRIY